MLTEKGISDIRSFLPLIDDSTLSELKESPNIGDREIQDFVSRYSNRFTAEESLEAVKGLSRGLTFAQFDYCADVCDALKRECTDETMLLHGFDETVRLYCLAFESGETLQSTRHLDDMVKAMRTAERFASMYQEDDERPYLISNTDELYSFPLTPDGYIATLLPCTNYPDNPIIAVSYYIDLKHMCITGQISPSALWDTPHNKDREPFMTRNYYSLNEIIDALEDILDFEPFDDLFNLTGVEISKGFIQYCERSGKHFSNIIATPQGVVSTDRLPTIGKCILTNTAEIRVHAIEYEIVDKMLVSTWTNDGYPIGGAEWCDIQSDEDGRNYIEYAGGRKYTDEIMRA